MTQCRLEESIQSTFRDTVNITHYLSCSQSEFCTGLLRLPVNLQCRQMQAYTQYLILYSYSHYTRNVKC